MNIIGIATEQTTAATDLILTLVCFLAARYTWRLSRQFGWLYTQWTLIFSVIGAGSFFDACAHGLEVSGEVRHTLFRGVYITLGFAVAFFVVAAFYDLIGEKRAKKLQALMMFVACFFIGLILFWRQQFLLFVVYELIAMLAALCSYGWLLYSRKRADALWMCFGVALSIAAAGVQATAALSFSIVWSFDHNGVFHLIQIVSIGALIIGLKQAQIVNRQSSIEY